MTGVADHPDIPHGGVHAAGLLRLTAAVAAYAGLALVLIAVLPWSGTVIGFLLAALLALGGIWAGAEAFRRWRPDLERRSRIDLYGAGAGRAALFGALCWGVPFGVLSSAFGVAVEGEPVAAQIGPHAAIYLLGGALFGVFARANERRRRRSRAG